jgi:4,5-DOPA dioxygenase extradiol
MRLDPVVAATQHIELLAALGDSQERHDPACMTTPAALPALFVSHGSPMMAIEESATSRFLEHLGENLPRPKAIVVASAHFAAAFPTLTAATAPATIHDFGGFPAPLYGIEYGAPGAPELAERIARLLATAGFNARQDDRAGFDHGVWVPLRRMFPQADIPVVALSVNPQSDAEWHYRIGRVLAPLREEGVLVIGSGSFSHNLRALDWRGAEAPASPWMLAFTDALRDRLLDGDVEGALNWRTLPEALRNHPTPEHLFPLYVALGAGGDGAHGRLLHRDIELGSLAMDAFAFE